MISADFITFFMLKMKKKLAKKHISDTYLIQGYSQHILQRNVYLRDNGIFYFRKTVKGKAILKSLQTKDPLLAVFLTNRLREKLMNEDDIISLVKSLTDPKAQKKREEEFLKQAEKANRHYEQSVLAENPDYILRKQIFLSLHPDKSEDYIFDNMNELYTEEINNKLNLQNTTISSAQPTVYQEPHKMIDIWKEYRYEHYIKNKLLTQKNKIKDIDNQPEEDLINLLTKHNRNELNRHDGHMKIILESLPETIEEIDNNPTVLKELMNKLYVYEYEPGKHWASNALSRVLEPIKGMLKESYSKLLLHNYGQCRMNLNKETSKIQQATKIRLPFDNTDLKKIFKMCVDLLNHDFSFIKSAKEDKTNPIHKKKNFIIRKTNKKTLVELYPESIVYSAILALYSGCRANACSTIRFKNIDIENKTISIEYDDEDDIRSQEKRLKDSNVSNASIREIPWPDMLTDLGFEKYVKHNKREYGAKAYVYEGTLRTNKKNKDKLTYRTGTINEIFNQLLLLLRIQLAPETNTVKTFHSLKTTFYSYNQKLPDKAALRALAGNKPPKNSNNEEIHYEKSNLDLMREALKQIKYPGEEILHEYINSTK